MYFSFDLNPQNPSLMFRFHHVSPKTLPHLGSWPFPISCQHNHNWPVWPGLSYCINITTDKCLQHREKWCHFSGWKNNAFTLGCSFCGRAGTLSSHLRISTPVCHPPLARLVDSETHRTVHPGSWHTLYSFQNPDSEKQKESWCLQLLRGVVNLM